MLLSCSHLFCGSCLFTKLQEKACCPACNMDLRAIPVRCLAMDRVAASVVPSLSTEEQQQYSKRKQDGQCVADQINKMFHHLAPPALHPLNAALQRPTAAIPSVPPAACTSAAGSLEPVNPLTHRASFPAEGVHPLQPALQQQQYMNSINLAFGSLSTAATPPSLLQLAAAQQLHQVQQQLIAMHLHPGVAACPQAQYPCRQYVSDDFSLQQMVLGHSQDHNSLLGSRSHTGLSAAASYHELQLSSMMGSTCQV